MIIVTGAAGFIGRNVAKEFARGSWTITGIDRIQVSSNFGKKWLFDDFCTIELNSNTIDELLQTYLPDLIIHCAGSASVPFSVLNPKKDFYLSADLLIDILESIRIHNHDTRLIFLSSAAVYGNPQYLPIDEKHPCIPISPYGYHKLICETLLREFYLLYGIQSCSARIFSAYGDGLDRQVMWDICQKTLNKSKIKLFGTGEESRDFIHVKDVVAGLEILSQKAEFKAESYNLASGLKHSIVDISSKLIKALNINRQVFFSGIPREGDPREWRADISLIDSLGFHPKISIDQGINDYANYFLEKN